MMKGSEFKKRFGRGAGAVCGLIVLAVVAALVTSAVAAGPNLVAAFFVKGKVGLKWRKIEGVEEYSVHRKTAGGEFTKISSTDEDHYFDIDIVSGGVYIYKIGIIGAAGEELFSAEKSVTIPGVEAGEFTPPVWVGARVEQDRIYLNWDPVPGAVAYNVLRSTTPGGGYEIIGNSQTSKYADKTDLVGGTTYYYVLSALNAEFDETEYSAEESLKFGMSIDEQNELLKKQNEIVLIETKLEKLFEITDRGPYGPMEQPADVFVNSKGDIYVTDAGNAEVHCFEANGKYRFTFGERVANDRLDDPPPGAFQIPFTLFIDHKDQVWVSDIDARDIQVFTADGKFIRRFRVDTGAGKEKLKATGIHVLDDGRVILVDSHNHRFLITDQDGNILLSKGERGARPGQFNHPDEVTVTKDGTICIVDIMNCRVQEFDLDGNFIRAFGQPGYSAGMFGRPKGIALDEQGRLWVSDVMSNIIQCFTLEGEVKSAVGTVKDQSIRFIAPRGIFFKNGRFYVVNQIPHSVVVYKVG